MIREEFRPILENLEAGRCAVLHRTVDGVEYTRLFRPRERLILLGGGHIGKPGIKNTRYRLNNATARFG